MIDYELSLTNLIGWNQEGIIEGRVKNELLFQV